METGIILKSKQSKILLALRDTTQNWYVSSLATASGTTYVHTCNFINHCESVGIVSSEKHGKIKVVKLTEKGIKIAESISNIITLMSQAPVQQEPLPQPKT